MKHEALRSAFKLSIIALTLCVSNAQAAAALNDAEILTILKQRIDQEKMGASIVVGIIDKQGSRVISHGYANLQFRTLADADTVFEIGSITKVFTGLILMDMAEKGEVGLNEPVEKYLPTSVTVPRRAGKQISLRDLSTHVSGLPRMPGNFAPKDPKNPYIDYTQDLLYQFLSTYQLPRDIGSKPEYSNLGAGLLGHALSLRAGSDYETLVRSRILMPLKMQNTGINLTADMKKHLASPYVVTDEFASEAKLTLTSNWDLGVFNGAGGLRSSMNDMLKFLAANMGEQESSVQAVVNKMQEPLEPREPGKPVRLAWGGGNKYGSEITSHTGGTGGYRSYIGFDRKAGKGVVVLSNATTEVGDIGSKIINSEFRLLQLKMPITFVQAVEKAGYDQANAIYQALKAKDADFFLREEVLNEWAYSRLKTDKTRSVLELFKLSVYLYPKSANAYDSLAEAYEAVGMYELAGSSYQKSLELNPQNQNAIQRLKVLADAAKK
ncbi:serine hydrolase [Undibacterium umbellatum]|uniref:Class A beta-lactamase-related serine hydrolase n=1 Tax=Undibacterium umbellatum TaxID=2762300 RepID=A0ABR6Z4J4_9BURK|nr:serine hydrolase [Undibacterium umbellatum]MBC3906708.1 class A beta-lactamase-related serine hydrolase [Undibacterium umbellatum]